MLGEMKKVAYGSKEVHCFNPYSLNELYITSDKSALIEKAIFDIDSLFPIESPTNKFFLDLLKDQEMLHSKSLSGTTQSFADIYAENPYNIFKHELTELQDLYSYAPEHMKKLGYCNRFLKDLHHALFHNVQTFYPGEFRTTLSYLGKDMDSATYVSPEVEVMQNNMDEMELFMHRDDISVFIRSALLYYQIMANLPFLIGNQEIARLSSLLYLIEFDGLTHYIPLSKHLANIEEVRIKAMELGDINVFILEYLTCIKKAIIDTKRTIKGYNALKRKQEKIIDNSHHTIYQKRRLHEILRRSHKTIYLDSEMLIEEFQVLNKTIVKRYRYLIELKILKTKKTYFSKQYYNVSMLRLLT